MLRDVSRHDLIFSNGNNENWLEVRSKPDDSVVFRSPSTSFDRVVILESDQLVIGLSNVKLWNPYQLVVFNMSGRVIFRKHFADKEAIFSPEELERFFQRHPGARGPLLNRIWRRDQITSYVDFGVVGMPNAVGEAAWEELTRRAVPNPLAKFIQETVSNYVKWFDSERSDVFVTTGQDGLRILVVPGLRGQAVEVPLKDQIPVNVGKTAPAA